MFILVYLTACVFVGVKVGYWGKNWGTVFQKDIAEGAALYHPLKSLFYYLHFFLFGIWEDMGV